MTDKLEALVSLREQAATYHHHKETLAITVALTHIGAALTVPWTFDPTSESKSAVWAGFWIITIAVYGVVGFQLWNRCSAFYQVDELNKDVKALLGDNTRKITETSGVTHWIETAFLALALISASVPSYNVLEARITKSERHKPTTSELITASFGISK